MALWDRVTQFLALVPLEDHTPLVRTAPVEGSISDFAQRIMGVNPGIWRLPSIREALSVPANLSAVSLIASTTGMLSVLGYRNGEQMADTPRLLSRPDPFHTPYYFYSTTAAQLAKAGEFVWWIASRDSDGLAAALINVPLAELTVEENPDSRLYPIYKWGKVTGTRFSAANPEGDFVHEMYPLGEPMALRGQGPLQICGAASSVSVEAQAWAANFYAEGGHPATVIKKNGVLSPEKLDPLTWTPDPLNVSGGAKSEADLLRDQVIGRSNNTAMVIDDTIESIEFKAPDTVAAQMLDARQHQNGDSARMFRIPGSLLEYQQAGASLTYQNLEGEFTKFVRGCLQPLYLEPIEQVLSDLLTRSTSARFNIDAVLRADIKTRFEVHGIAIDKGIYGPDYAQKVEGIAAGDVEFAPVLSAPPTAIPSSLPTDVRTMRDVRCPSCNRLITRSTGKVEGRCGHCKLTFLSEGENVRVEAPRAEAPTIEFHANFPPGFVRVEAPVTVHSPDVHVEPIINVPEQPAPIVNVTNPPPPLRIRRMERDDAGNLTIRDEHVPQEGVA